MSAGSAARLASSSRCEQVSKPEGPGSIDRAMCGHTAGGITLLELKVTASLLQNKRMAVPRIRSLMQGPVLPAQ